MTPAIVAKTPSKVLHATLAAYDSKFFTKTMLAELTRQQTVAWFGKFNGPAARRSIQSEFARAHLPYPDPHTGKEVYGDVCPDCFFEITADSVARATGPQDDLGMDVYRKSHCGISWHRPPLLPLIQFFICVLHLLRELVSKLGQKHSMHTIIFVIQHISSLISPVRCTILGAGDSKTRSFRRCRAQDYAVYGHEKR